MSTHTQHPAGELQHLLQRLQTEDAVLVSVCHARGSVPREDGTWMAVFAQHCIATIGGGHLEWAAMHHARELLSQHVREPSRQAVVLGPSLGQCCGGALELLYERVGAADAPALRERMHHARQPVALFGGGHVGRALVHALGPLPFALSWIDSRDQVFPEPLPEGVSAEHSEPVQGAVPTLAPGSHVLIMSFSHAEDLDIVAACLRRQRERGDLGFIGLIGSRSKWASFRSRLRERGFDEHELARITCPIGLPGISGKAPAVIAAAVVAQLLLLPEQTPEQVPAPGPLHGA